MNRKIFLFFMANLLLLPFTFSLFGEENSKGWMPEWKVGDWWIVKSTNNASKLPQQNPPEWIQPLSFRYEVLGIEEINGQLCFAVEKKGVPSQLVKWRSKTVYYFKKDDLRPIKEMEQRIDRPEQSESSYSLDYIYKNEEYERPLYGSVMSFPVFHFFSMGQRQNCYLNLLIHLVALEDMD